MTVAGQFFFQLYDLHFQDVDACFELFDSRIHVFFVFMHDVLRCVGRVWWLGRDSIPHLFPVAWGTSAVGSLWPESLASDSNRDCAGLESAASAGWTSEGLDYREFSACFVLPVLRIYSSCVTIDISAERRYPMNPKDWFDVTNGIIANILAVIAIIIAIRRRPKHKK